MELTFLGTGGSQPVPLPLCNCGLCSEASEQGAPYTRYGYSMYLPELRGMIDASEFAPFNLNRWGVTELDRLFLTHWHPDHTAGLRLLTMRPGDPREGETHLDMKRRTAPTVVTTREVYERTCNQVRSLRYFVEELGLADVHFLDERPFRADGFRVEAVPYPLSAGGPEEATGFVFHRGEESLAVVADDARYFDWERLPAHLDAAVFECGHFTHGPDGDRIRAEGEDADDLSHDEVRRLVRRVDPDRAFLSHISHHYRHSYDDLREREREYDRTQFAHDGLSVTV